MNAIALAWKLIKLQPQLTAIYERGKPIVETLPELFKALKPAIKPLQHTAHEVQAAWPQLQPLLQAVIAEISPDMLKPTEEHYDVKWLQDSLNKLGANLEIDGDYGPRTKAAVEHFQKAHSLNVDGWAGIQTSAAIHDALK